MLNDLFLTRQSCRNFDGEKQVERDKLERVMENVRLSPSACNSQPYSFIVVTNKELAEKVGKQTQELGVNKHCKNVHCFIVVCEETANLLSRTAGRVKDQQFAQIDIGLAVSQLILSCEEEGLSTCMLGWFNEKNVKEILEIDKNKRVRLIVAVGYASSEDKIRPKKRKKIEDLVIYK